MPMPRAVSPNSWRRVRWRSSSRVDGHGSAPSSALLLRDRLVEIENRRLATVGPRRELRRRRAARRAATRRPLEQLVARRCAILARTRRARLVRAALRSTPVSLPRRLARGREPEGVGDARRRRPCRPRAARAAPAPAPPRRRSGRSAAPAPAAACWSARAAPVHFSRSGASNVASDAGGTVRFQNVYMPRR